MADKSTSGCMSPPTGEKRESMPRAELLKDADDATLIAWTLWLRAGELKRQALIAEERAARGVASDSNSTLARANRIIAGRLVRLAVSGKAMES